MMKVVLKLEYMDEKVKQKVMKKASVLEGVESIGIEVNEKKLTVTGNVDPVSLVKKVKKLCHTEIVLVGPAKEPEKKKEEPKKEDDNKKDQVIKAFPAPIYYHQPYHYYQTRFHSMEEDPNSCVIS